MSRYYIMKLSEVITHVIFTFMITLITLITQVGSFAKVTSLSPGFTAAFQESGNFGAGKLTHIPNCHP